ncbi:MAG TPA: hypothetical protein VM689_01900 [Aliidongia sp.]|nr:hypothetical protein [Aliidongia sp.]
MRVLLAANIIMGVLIVAGVLTIVITLINRAVHPRQPTVAVAAGPAGHAEIKLPAGAALREIVGAGERVVLHIVTADGHDRLLTLDPMTGAVAETVDLIPEQP